MAHLIKGLLACKDNLLKINIGGNLGSNNKPTITEILNIIKQCYKLKSLNISAMGIKKKNCKLLIKAINDKFKESWNLNNELRELIWNDDLKCSPSTAIQFLSKDLPSTYNLKL